MIIELSRRISSEDDIRRLGVNGLGVPAHIVDNCLRNRRNDLNWATYDMLEAWSRNEESRTQAYTDLCIAVRKVHMDFLIKEVLESEDHDVGSLAYPDKDSKFMSIERFGFPKGYPINIYIYALTAIVTIYISSHDVINYSYR